MSVGTRAPQSFTTRGSMYNKDSLLEFFNTAAGVYPSVTGTGFGIQVSKIGGKKLKVLNGSVAGSIGYITNEGDASNPASYNYLQEGFLDATPASVCPSSSPGRAKARSGCSRPTTPMSAA